MKRLNYSIFGVRPVAFIACVGFMSIIYAERGTPTEGGGA